MNTYVVNLVHRGSNLFVSDANTTTVAVNDLYPCTIYHVRVCAKGASCTPTQIVATSILPPLPLPLPLPSPPLPSPFPPSLLALYLLLSAACEAPLLLSMSVESPTSSLSSAPIRLSWESPEFNEALYYYRYIPFLFFASPLSPSTRVVKAVSKNI